MRRTGKMPRRKKGTEVLFADIEFIFLFRLLKEAKQQENALKKKQGDDKQNAALREKWSKARAEEEERQRTSAASITFFYCLFYYYSSLRVNRSYCVASYWRAFQGKARGISSNYPRRPWCSCCNSRDASCCPSSRRPARYSA